MCTTRVKLEYYNLNVNFFILGEISEAKPQTITEAPPPSQLPGKKAYIPPYTPKSNNRDPGGSGQSSRAGRSWQQNSGSASTTNRSNLSSRVNQRNNQYSSPGNRSKRPKLLTDEEKLEVDSKYHIGTSYSMSC